MKNLKIILLITGILIHLSSYCQNDSIIKSGYVNMATLIVDYDTYNFDGGNISYYTCSDCVTDSIPFTIDFHELGILGRITFEFLNHNDTIFDATIIHMGEGQISYPNEFSLQSPFINGSSLVNKPNDLKYIHWDGNTMDSNSANDLYYMDRANLAWNKIDQLAVTNQFAEKGFKSAIYLYAPTVGLFDPAKAKWIIFLYRNEIISSISSLQDTDALIRLFPNPIKNGMKINVNLKNEKITSYHIYNSYGQLINKGDFLNRMNQIDLTSFKRGIYLIQLGDTQGSIIKTEKIVIE